MRTSNFNLAPSLVAVALTLMAITASAAAITGRVVGIADGDSLTLLDAANTQYKIRLSGIDSPEKGQPFGLNRPGFRGGHLV